jgi:hypothetical protein
MASNISKTSADEEKKIQQNSGNNSVPFTISFPNEAAQALIKYQKDMKLPFAQDVIRLAVSVFLKKSGYLK